MNLTFIWHYILRISNIPF